MLPRSLPEPQRGAFTKEDGEQVIDAGGQRRPLPPPERATCSAAHWKNPALSEYLKPPPSRDTLLDLMRRADLTPRALLREKGAPYAELGLADPALTDDELVDAMMAHSILINRPLVVTPLGVKLCRPSEAVLEARDLTLSP